MKRFLKWAGIGVGSLVALVLVAVAAVYLISNARLSETYAIALPPLAVPADSAALAAGAHGAIIRGCTDCHGEGLEGQLFLDAMPVGRLYASNLTAGEGGVGADYTDEDWDRAIRHGVGPDGKPLLFMPSHEYHGMSDDDVAAIVAFIKSRPAVDNVLPASTVGPLGRMLHLAGELPLLPAELIDHEASRAPAPPRGATAAYGAYLAATCTGCHGMDLSGGPIPGMPPDTAPAANLTPHADGLGAWTEADFFAALRDGVRPDGTEIDPFMPVRMTKQMTDDEIRAIWLHLRTIEPKPDAG